MKQQIYTIDATDRILGRLAVEIAVLLRGKNNPDFVPYKESDVVVVVKNVDKLRVTGKKMEQKKYYRHSGYLGSLKEKPLKTFFAENPAKVLQEAVFGMLPKNKLRARVIKRLRFDDDK